MSRRLGKGLEEIIETGARGALSVVMLRTEQIRANRFQPRTVFGEQELEELKVSIKKQGVLQPVLVRPIAHGTYELVAGERRWRAAQAAGLAEIPAIVRTLTDREAVEYSLIENVQRQDLNPLEEASAYRRLLEEFGHTQEEIAEGVGKDRATIANALRLLKLPAEVQQALRETTISVGHAKVLLGIEGAPKQLELLARVIRDTLSVRELEALAGAAHPLKRRRLRRTDPQLGALEEQLRRVLATKVSLVSRKKGGRLVIEYFSADDLTRILHMLGVSAS